jgi:UDP-N-acetylglucosamine 2-epimerase (non-hydrolysing)
LQHRSYHIATLHRAETVDVPSRLESSVRALELTAERTGIPVVLSIHPRTRQKLEKLGISTGKGIIASEPFGFHDFVRLMNDSASVLTDSGTVQEEACILGRPCVVMRDVTERPELMEAGSLILAGLDPVRVAAAVDFGMQYQDGWSPPHEYLEPNVAEKVVRLVLGHRSNREAV